MVDERMAAPKTPRGGRHKRVPGEPTRPYPVNLTERERARLDALAESRGTSTADVVRDAALAECDAAGIPFDPRQPADG